MNRLVYISHCSPNKAKLDTEHFLDALGAVNIGLRPKAPKGKATKFLHDLGSTMAATLRMRRHDVVVLQYPLRKYFRWLCRVARMRGASTVALVHDLGCFRRKKIAWPAEKRKLELAAALIPTNEVMLQWLAARGITLSMAPLGLWDYHASARPAATPIPGEQKHSIVYAGGLSRRKNAFLYQAGEALGAMELHIFGDGLDISAISSPNIHYHGGRCFEDLIAAAPGGWGLVWDGASCSTCDGAWGEYLAINTPHKVSFYLRMGKPLIVWSGSAMAPAVQRLGIGIAVDSIAAIPAAVDAVTDAEYALMCANVQAESAGIARGEHLRAALAALRCLPASAI